MNDKERIEKQAKFEPLFRWCKSCRLYQDCYFQESGIIGPAFLEPDCAEGPA